jgi:hypothetical protein
MADDIPTAVVVVEHANQHDGFRREQIQQMLPTSLDEAKRERVAQVLADMDIQPIILTRVARALNGGAYAFVLDNSASMRTPVRDSSFALPGESMTRHQEMLCFLKIVLPLVVSVTPEGVDVWLLNHPLSGVPGPYRIQNVQGMDQLTQHLHVPKGNTPLVPALMQVFAAHRHNIAGEGLHVVVVTDGQPDDYNNESGRSALFKLLAHNSAYRPSPEKCTVSFLVASDSHKDVAYLDMLDRQCPFVDVTDDYASERAQVARSMRFPRALSVADWALKAAVYDPEMDAADEPACCCIL